MSENEIREPIQKRSIEKKEKIIKCGFDLICEKGYYNTNTAEIAKSAGVSTGIIYQYFKDKHDILIAGIEKYACDIFYPMLNVPYNKIDKQNLDKLLSIETGMPVYIADEPLDCVVRGTGKTLEDLERLKTVLINARKRK